MVALAIISLCSCSHKALPVQVVTVVTHDTILVQQLRVDSVTRLDSVYEYVQVSGDTVVREKTKYIELLKYKVIRDSVYILSTDTTEIPVQVPVEKKLTLWQKAKIKYGGFSMLAMLLAISYLVRSAYRRCKEG